uniref:Uncharacterized protein n=1 Tax=Anguilla anguilla TaxID=7936 RepID=A0A0E9TXK6_ANGAN
MSYALLNVVYVLVALSATPLAGLRNAEQCSSSGKNVK